MNRNIEINIIHPIEEPTLQKAIARLSIWAINHYDDVRIYSRSEKELLAHYTKAGIDRTFTMGAILGKDGEWSYHS
jgi:hypothetical protein